ncbi:MAG TPA: hypothetical protein VME69_17035 [Methylocella sp.]|nr:hypothetical protein [Methylocella sp.]
MRFGIRRRVDLWRKRAQHESQRVEERAGAIRRNHPQRRMNGVLSKKKRKQKEKLRHHEVVDMRPKEVIALGNQPDDEPVRKKQRHTENPGNHKREG